MLTPLIGPQHERLCFFFTGEISSVTAAPLYGQPRPDEGNGFRECFTLHQGPPVLAKGPKIALAMEMQGTLTAAPFLGTQHVHFPGPHLGVGIPSQPPP